MSRVVLVESRNTVARKATKTVVRVYDKTVLFTYFHIIVVIHTKKNKVYSRQLTTLTFKYALYLHMTIRATVCGQLRSLAHYWDWFFAVLTVESHKTFHSAVQGMKLRDS